MNEEPLYGRRLADVVARWATAAASVLAAGLLTIVVYFYGSMPEEIRAMRESMAVVQVELRVVKEEQRELIDANRVNQNWRERLVTVESKVERLEQRVNRIEDRVGRDAR